MSTLRRTATPMFTPPYQVFSQLTSKLDEAMRDLTERICYRRGLGLKDCDPSGMRLLSEIPEHDVFDLSNK